MAVRIAVLASGRGSNFRAIATAVAKGEVPDAVVTGLITHNPKALALKIADELGIPSFLVSSKARDEYEMELLRTVKALSPDLVCLAGYMRLVGAPLLEAFPDRIINIHPSLLPSFRGLKAQKQALDYGVQWTGCTVHFVTAELDGGPPIDQSPCEVLPTDTEETLSERLLPIEHKTYIRAITKLATHRCEVRGQRVVFL